MSDATYSDEPLADGEYLIELTKFVRHGLIFNTVKHVATVAAMGDLEFDPPPKFTASSRELALASARTWCRNHAPSEPDVETIRFNPKAVPARPQPDQMRAPRNPGKGST